MQFEVTTQFWKSEIAAKSILCFLSFRMEKEKKRNWREKERETDREKERGREAYIERQGWRERVSE